MKIQKKNLGLGLLGRGWGVGSGGGGWLGGQGGLERRIEVFGKIHKIKIRGVVGRGVSEWGVRWGVGLVGGGGRSGWM